MEPGNAAVPKDWRHWATREVPDAMLRGGPCATPGGYRTMGRGSATGGVTTTAASATDADRLSTRLWTPAALPSRLDAPSPPPPSPARQTQAVYLTAANRACNTNSVYKGPRAGNSDGATVVDDSHFLDTACWAPHLESCLASSFSTCQASSGAHRKKEREKKRRAMARHTRHQVSIRFMPGQTHRARPDPRINKRNGEPAPNPPR